MENQTVVTDATTTAGVVTATTTTGTMPNTVTATPVVEQPKQTEPKQQEKPKADAEVEKLKEALSRANSQAAEFKRQLREKQTEAERAEAERAEADKAMREELETLRKEKSISDYTNRCVTLGFDGDLATETATALSDGNMDSLFDCLKRFVDATKVKLTNEALNRQPSLSAGVPPTTKTTEEAQYEQMRRWAGLPPRK